MIRKSIFFIAVIFTFSLNINAQLGVYLGYNLAKVDGSVAPLPSLSEKKLSNLSMGIFFDKDIIPLIDIRLGLMYSPKGSRFVDGDSYAKTTINYIEIPLQAKLKIGPVYALGGIYGGMALNGKVKNLYSNGVLIVGSDRDLDFKSDDYKKLDYGLKFGAGFQFGIGPVHIFAQGDYSFGLMNIHDAQGAEWKNNVIGVSTGLILGF